VGVAVGCARNGTELHASIAARSSPVKAIKR
jgi:hypothetical protein